MPPKRRLVRVRGIKKEQDSSPGVVLKSEHDVDAEEVTEIEVPIVQSSRKQLLDGKDIMSVEDSVNNALKAALHNMIEKPRKRRKKARKKTLLDIASKKTYINCNECKKRFRFTSSYQKHKVQEHSKSPNSVTCPKCPVRCPNKNELKLHISSVHERQMFSCPQCDKKFVRNAHVLRHMSQKGCYGVVPTHYPCEICNTEFSRKDNLLVHMRLQHLTSKDFMCKHCSYSTCTFSKLIVHKQKYHSEGQTEFECDHCGRVVTSRAAMTKHLEIHGEKKFACDVCGYKTFTLEVMRRHVLTHVKSKPYQCDKCDRSFIQRSQLEKHMDKHVKQYSCKGCAKTFLNKTGLAIHKKTCSASDDDDDNDEDDDVEEKNPLMKRKKYSCEVCGKEYRSESFMRRHIVSHTLERPRRCMYCVTARAYVRGEQLVRHVRKAHPQLFKDHLGHVRQVLGTTLTIERVKKSEMDAILNLLDAEADRILEGYGEGVLYGGMQVVEVDNGSANSNTVPETSPKEDSPIMSKETLTDSLNTLLSRLIDKEVLECFGWPEESVDTVLEKVLEHCGAKTADRDKWSLPTRLRENAKQLFLCVVEDKTVARMLTSHTIDHVIRHILHTWDK